MKWKRAGKFNQWKPIKLTPPKDEIVKEVLKEIPSPKRGDRGERGLRGLMGEKGDKPKHKWDGTKLQFEKPDGKWGKKVDLGAKGGDNSNLWISEDFTDLRDTPENYTDADDRLVTVDGNGLTFGVKMTASDTEPTDPQLWDLWFDTSG